MNSPWPFAIWGIDLVRSLPTGKGGVKYTIIVVDYLTKWVEAKPMNIVTSKKSLDFVIKNIVCCFRLQHEIVLNNGKQFDSDHFTNFCNQYKFMKSFSSVARSQENGKVKAVNKILKTSLKKKLQACKAHWLEEPLRSKPVETTVPSHGRETYDPTHNHSLIKESLDLIKELWEQSQVQLKMYQGKISKLFNSKVKSRTFDIKDLTMRRIFPALQEMGVGVLGPNWEGPYEIQHKVGNGTFQLKRMDGNDGTDQENYEQGLLISSSPCLTIYNSWVEQARPLSEDEVVSRRDIEVLEVKDEGEVCPTSPFKAEGEEEEEDEITWRKNIQRLDLQTVEV
ncbi:hypothetical protein CsatB_007761 [Cannabis sativa]